MDSLCRKDLKLMISIITGQVEEAKRLIESGADINCADSQGITPILMTISYNRPDIAKLLVSKGVDLSISTKQGHNLLAYALAFNRHWLSEFGILPSEKF